MKTPVFAFEVPGLVKVRITGNNTGRLDRYCKRLECGDGDSKAKVKYTANKEGKWSFVDPKDNAPNGNCDSVEALPVFYETTYQVHCEFDNKDVHKVHVVHTLASIADEFDFDNGQLTGPLNFVNTPGKFTFEVAYSIGQIDDVLKIDWWVVSEKLDVAEDYKTIVDRVESASSGIIYAFLSKTRNAAGLSDGSTTSDAVWYDIFREFVSTYREACDYIVHRPHLKYVSHEQFMRPDRIKHWSPQLANRYQEMDRGRRDISYFRSEDIVPEVDTVENRFVLFTLREISKRLMRFADRCSTEGAGKVSEEFVKQMRDEATALEKITHIPFFRQVGRFMGLRQESLALQRKQGYAEIYDTWLKLQRSLDLTGDGLNVGNRPIWKLYEFWCFLVIRDFLQTKYKDFEGGLGDVAEPSDIFEDPYDEATGEPKRSENGKKCEYTFRDPGNERTITLTYQMSYGAGKESGDDPDGNFSYVVEQIPDIVMTIRVADGKVFTYLFDAKYRVMPYPSALDHKADASPHVAINDMHRYRDAILYRAQKGEKLSQEVIGAYVLYPGRCGKSFDYGTIIERENIGAIPLLPCHKGEENSDKDGEKALRVFLDKILGKSESGEHLASAKSTRGTTVVVGKGFSEESIPTIVLQPNEWPTFGRGEDFIGVSSEQVSKIPKDLPALIRLKCNGKPELIVKIIAVESTDRITKKTCYKIEWTTDGSVSPGGV